MRQTQVTSCSCLVLLFASMTAAPALAQLPIGELTTLYPAGGQQGTTLAVTAGGANLVDGEQLIFNHAGITAKVKQIPPAEFRKTGEKQYNQFDVSIAKNVPAGRYEARVVGRYGASSPRVFEVGGLTEVLDDGSNKSFETAKSTALNTITSGRVDAATRDYLKLALRANQRVIIDCAANRIDSRMVPVLVLFDANKKQVARSRSNLYGDAMIDFTAAVDGEYVLMLHDFLYLGGAEYFYRLKVHTQPHIDFILPLAAIPGSKVPYTVFGRNLPNGVDSGMSLNGRPLQKMVVNIAAPGNAARNVGAEAYVATAAATVDGFAAQPVGASPYRLGFAKTSRILLESEPNNEPNTAMVVQAPCEVHGQFYPRRDDDWIEFSADKGQVYWVEVISHRLGVPTDPYVAIQRVVKDDKGVVTLVDVAQADDPKDRNAKIGADFDTTTDDPTLRFVAPETATYRLRIRDQFGASRDDPRAAYRLIIREESPDFRLFAMPQQVKVANANQILGYAPVVRQGGSCLLRIDATRMDNFNDQIDLKVEGLPPGVTCREAVMPAGANTAWLVLEAAEDAKVASSEITIVGHAKIGEAEVNRPARPATIVWGTANKTVTRAEHRATQNLVLSVSQEKHQIGATLGDGKRIMTCKGAKVTIPLTLTRRGFAGDVKFVATNAPAELKPADVTVKGADSNGKVEWTLTNAKLKPGVYSFYLRGDVKVKQVPNPEAITRSETAQKEIVAAVAVLAEDVKKKTTARDAAAKNMTDAAAALKQAEQAMKTASADPQKAMAAKALAAAKLAADAAKAAKAAADKTLADTVAAQKRATAAKTAADKSLAAVKKANAAKDANILVISSPVVLEVAATPIGMKVTPPAAVKQGEKASIQFAFDRQFGFAEAINVTLAAPAGAKGLAGAKLSVAKDAKAGTLEFTAAADAAPGNHTVTIKAAATFNKVPVETVQTVVVRIDAK